MKQAVQAAGLATPVGWLPILLFIMGADRKVMIDLGASGDLQGADNALANCRRLLSTVDFFSVCRLPW